MQCTPVIGLEVHVQLLTKTKIFCGCANRFNPDEPNSQTCPVCLGLPGALPVMNEEAFRLSLITALALECEIAPFTKWDRKQYFYPDLPKGYQISQYDLPFSSRGKLEIASDVERSGSRTVRITRAHLEEDAGKNMHDESGRGSDSRVDLNRAGTPLLEIVSEPDLRSAAEARSYLEELHLLLTYLGVSDCNMQEGSLRCDANVNLHIEQDGETVATPIVEVKNLNSFRAVEAAVNYEIERQQRHFEQTGQKLGDPGVSKETRGWDADREVTLAQRGKEEASDYRYFPDPDLVPVTVEDSQREQLRDSLCELPAARRKRFRSEYELSGYDADVVVNQGRAFADYFEQTAQISGDAKQAANWSTQTVLRELNERSQSIDQFAISSEVLGELLRRIAAGELTVASAREVFATLLGKADEGDRLEPASVGATIDSLGLAAVTDSGALKHAVDQSIAQNEKAAEDVRAGKMAAIGPLVGGVMRQVKGADAKVVRQLILERLNS